MITRSQFFGTAAAFTPLVFGVTSTPVHAQSEDAVRFTTGPFESQGTAWYAENLDLYKRAGLAVDLEILPSANAIMAGIAGRSIDVGFGPPIPVAQARERGLDFVLIAPGALNPIDSSYFPYGLLVTANAPLHNAKDFMGKTVAITVLGSTDNLALYAWLDGHGADSKTVKLVEIPQAAMGEAVASGRIDGAVIAQPALGAALADSRLRMLTNPFEALGHVMMTGMFSTRDWADKHADDVRKLRGCINEAAAWATKNPEAAAAVLRKYLKTTTQTTHEFHAPSLDSSVIQPLLDTAFRYKLLPQKIDARQIIWNG